jgi:hypothetical protein
MAMAQVTNNPAMADGSSIHQEAKQQLHQYLRTYIQPLLKAGKPLDLKDISIMLLSGNLSWFSSWASSRYRIWFSSYSEGTDYFHSKPKNL